MTSKYQAIFTQLRKEIFDGRYSAAGAFPSENGICKRFGVSRTTAVKVMESLLHENLVVRRRGSGTFVTATARRRTGSIGLIVPGLSYGEIFPPICQAIVRTAAERGYSVVLGDISARNPQRRAAEARRVAQMFIERRSLGVIFQPLAFLRRSDAASTAILADLDAAGVPTVLLDRSVDSAAFKGRDFVGIDNFAAGRCLARALVADGVRRVWFWMRPNCASVIGERLQGVRCELARTGSVREVKADPESVREVRSAVRGRLPEAIVCESDYVAAALRATLAKLPPDLKRVRFAGFDGLRYAQLMSAPYVTMAQPCEEIARTALELLLARLERPSAPGRKVLLSARLCRI